jgi:hypothetical protein
MAELHSISHADAVAKLAELKSLTESQQKELDSAIFQLEIFETARAAREPNGWEPAFAKVRAWVAAKKFPPGPAGPYAIWMIPLMRTVMTGDPEGLDFVLQNTNETERKLAAISQFIDFARKAVERKKTEAGDKSSEGGAKPP